MKQTILGSTLAVFVLSGCASTIASAPTIVGLGTAKPENPDKIWMVREVKVLNGGLGKKAKTLHGLFACYRKESPAFPICYLAEIKWRKEDLAWPGNLKLEGGKLVPAN
jgi:hypothetical protein